MSDYYIDEDDGFVYPHLDAPEIADEPTRHYIGVDKPRVERIREPDLLEMTDDKGRIILVGLPF